MGKSDFGGQKDFNHAVTVTWAVGLAVPGQPRGGPRLGEGPPFAMQRVHYPARGRAVALWGGGSNRPRVPPRRRWQGRSSCQKAAMFATPRRALLSVAAKESRLQ